MKLYLIISNAPDDLDDGARQSIWAGSQSDAASARKELLAAGAKRKDLATHEIDVPTKKDELIAFLNTLSAGPTVVAATEKLLAK